MNSTIINQTEWGFAPSSDSNIITESHLSMLKSMRMSTEERNRALNMRFFIPKLIPCGYHIVIFGPAGSGKTTVALHLAYQILCHNENVEIFFLYLDGELGMAARFEVFLEEKGMQDKLNILTSLNLNETLNLIEEVVHQGEKRPEEVVVFLDTLKYLNPNINNKDSNIKAMQRIRKLTRLGITFISLHHTNKDKKEFAGTADIEQDGDALLKITTAPGDEPHTRISTIEEGGRVRYLMEPRSYTFLQGDPTSVLELDEVIDPEKVEQLKKDSGAINLIKGLLNLKGELSKTELEEFLKEDDDFDYSEKERKRILKAYVGVHWKVRKDGNRRQFHYYSAIDHTSKHISSINEKIDAGKKGT